MNGLFNKPQQEQKAPASERLFIGRAWLNESKKGLQYINMSFGNDVKVIVEHNGQQYRIDKDVVMQGFENTKRPGKKDADVRLSIVAKQSN